RAARHIVSAACVAVLLACGTFVVQAAGQARPADATAQCKDGTYTTAKSKRGACSGHGGIGTWFADAGAAKDDAKTKTKAEAKSAASDTKAAAKETKDAAKSGAEVTKDATKSAAASTKNATKSAAGAAKDDTKAAAKTVA